MKGDSKVNLKQGLDGLSDEIIHCEKLLCDIPVEWASLTSEFGGLNKMNDYQIHGFDTSKLPEEGQIALAVKVFQTKTDSEWKVESIEELTLTKNQYLGIASKSTRSFFKGLNSTQKSVESQTKYGYIPTEIVSISPTKSKKITYEVFFDDELSYKYHLLKWQTQQAKEKMISARRVNE